MKFLRAERQILDSVLPGFDEALSSRRLLDFEKRGSLAVTIFKNSRAPSLLIPTSLGGLAATALQMVAVQRAIAARSPSLAIASTMHHFTVAVMREIASNSEVVNHTLQSIASDSLLVASGFAEGRPHCETFNPQMSVEPYRDGYRVNGSKKPCSLTYSMDLLTASATLSEQGKKELAVVLIPAHVAGIERSQFWSVPYLAGAESDEIRLTDVVIPQSHLIRIGEGNNLDSLQRIGFIWFQLLATASYIGVASALVERVLLASRGSSADLAQFGIEIEGAMVGVEGISRSVDSGERGSDILQKALFLRYGVQQSLHRVSTLAVDLLGGIRFMTDEEIGYLVGSIQALAFHPPSRFSMSESLAESLRGGDIWIR